MTTTKRDPLYSGEGSRPIPDPTALTSALVGEAISTLKEQMLARFDATDALAKQRHESLSIRVTEHSELDLRTIADTKDAVDVALKSAREVMAIGMEKLYERIAGVEKELSAKIVAHNTHDELLHASEAALINSRFDAASQLREAMQSAMKEAVDKAERANDARFEDGKRNMDRMAEQLRGMVTMAAFAEAQKAEQAYRDGIAARLSALETATAQRRGKDAGIGISWGAVVGAVSLVAGLIAFLSFTSNYHPDGLVRTQPPQVYVPAPPGALIPNAPTQPVQR